ncbi:Clp protease ClpP [Macrococcus bovicus]|nr:head maturation protease, ClpP-related [Macrococcus bovicus]WJP97071.1 Clp protease ClpP [Macrococcus bovicus]
MTKNKVDYFQMQRKTETEADIYIYGPIVSSKWDETDVTASGFLEELKALGEVSTINLHINSGGGNVFSGHAIYNMLKNHKATVNVYIDALAASIASVIAMAGDKVFMYENSMMMIHNSWIITMGNSKELRETADLMDKMDKSSNTAYLTKNEKITEPQLENLLKEDFWMTAQEALDLGFADEIIGANEIAASITKEQFEAYRSVPDQIAKDVDKVTDVTVILEQDIKQHTTETEHKPIEQSQLNRQSILERNRAISDEVGIFLLPKNYKPLGG